MTEEARKLTPTMRAAFLHKIGDIRLEEVPAPALDGGDQVLVHVKAVGICGSDLHYYEKGRMGTAIVREPLILGHEAAGEVVEVGEQVTDLQPGDRVAIEPGRTCGRCEFCKSGRYNLCREVIFLGTPPVHGAFCEYVAWPADFLFKLPDQMSCEEGAMMEPLAVGVHAARLSQIGLGDSVAVLGAGPIGLVSLQAAAAAGATMTIATDVIPYRLQMARQLGATHTLDANNDVVEAVMELTEGRGVDVVIDCVGLAKTVRQATRLARRGGHIQIVGMAADTADQFPLAEINNAELTLSGTFRYANCYPTAIAAAVAGRVDVKSLITHRFPLAEIPEAMAWVAENKEQVIKALIQFGETDTNQGAD